MDVKSLKMNLQVSQHQQSLCKYVDEIIFIVLFVSVTTINKFVLSELKFAVPTVFQGWQTLTCVILLSLFTKFNKVKSDLQILDARALSLLLPALVCFTVSIVAGSKALAELNVPIFLAITNLYPAILSFLLSKNELNNASLKICGNTAVVSTVIIILICTASPMTGPPLFWLLGHVFLNILYYLYLSKLNFDLTDTTQIYYRNFFSIVLLFPMSFYLDVLHLPSNRGWEFYVGCFFSGILGTFLQIWTFKIGMKSDYLQFEGFAKVLSSLISYQLFNETHIQNFIWVLIMLNFLICATFLKNAEKEKENVKSEMDLAIPPPYVKKIDSDLILLV